MTGRSHLVIGDTHADPDHPNDRFDWLGKLILDRKPDVIVQIGDFADMGSLSSYDKGKKSFEGRRYVKDVQATIDAQQRLFAPMNAYNAVRKLYKEKQYRPEIYMTGGNHDEGRISKTVDASPELEGKVSIEDLKYREFGWRYVPYTQPLCVDGVYYCHHFPGGNSRFPISGVGIGRKLLQRNHRSSTVGHTHILDAYSEVAVDHSRMWGLSVGCYFEHTPDYAGESAKFWWRGVVFKHRVENGDYEPEFISIDTLRKQYA